MDQLPSVYPDLSDQRDFKLRRINEIKDYLIAKIREGEAMAKRLSKYIATFDYFDKTLIVLSAASRGISIISLATVIGASVGISSASFRNHYKNY